MPYHITLPTTSSVSLPSYLSSSSHPSLPHAASTNRSVLRSLLKTHKRLPPPQQTSHLPNLQSALEAYLSYLLAIQAGLSGRPIASETIDILLLNEPTSSWRPTLTAPSLPSRSPKRIKITGLDAELAFVLTTLAYTHTQLARSSLRTIHRAGIKPEGKTSAVTKAMKELLDAHAIHSFVASRAQTAAGAAGAGAKSSGSSLLPLDLAAPVQSALAALALAEATLLPVVKEDPYPAALAEERSSASTEWMVGTVKMAGVRAGLFARLCVMAGEHAGRAVGLLGQGGGGEGAAGKLDEGLVRYAQDLRRNARAKACRFLGVDAEGRGEVGEAIGWLRGARRELGGKVDEEGKNKGLGKLKREWNGRKEDKKIEKGGDEWGLDAGKVEEERVVEWLEKKWCKVNDTMTFQIVPPHEPLIASLPSGREYHSPKPFHPPSLDEATIAKMRAPPDPKEDHIEDENDDSDDENDQDPVGAFPGTAKRYSGNATYY